jgi:hypothetical protein
VTVEAKGAAVKLNGILATCLGALTLAACAASGSHEPLQPVKLARSDIEAIERGVRLALKDPDSARFDGIESGRDANGKLVVCGWVNAKNGYGEYSGRQPFVGHLAGNSFTVERWEPKMGVPIVCRGLLKEIV